MKIVVVEDRPELLHLRFSGDLVWSSRPPGEDALADQFGAGVYSRKLLVNGEQLGFVDSGGIGQLILFHKRFHSQGGKMVICQLPPLVRQTVELVELHRIIHIAADEPAARALLG